jgi:hypothetical protein
MGLNAWPYFRLYGGMFLIACLAVLMQSSCVFSGKKGVVDSLLLKARPLARAKQCSL